MMFDRVIAWLEEGVTGELDGFDERDVRTAVAALYYHMIAVDGVVSPSEIKRFTEVLQDQFGLSDEQVRELMRTGRDNDNESPGLFPFTAIINHSFSEEKRRRVVERLSDLADIDGIVHPLESEMLAHVRLLLKLS
jgi:uncharacterized tellurite resistance protein B-like protein